MIYVLLGPPASGKDTQAKKLSEKLRIPTISSGDLFRKEFKNNTELGKKAKEQIDKGVWVDDGLVYEMLGKHITKEKYPNGFILTGGVRRVTQVPLLDKLVEGLGDKIERVIHFDLDKEEIISRQRNRMEKDGIKRSDDKVTLERIKEHEDTIGPILDEYEKRNLLTRIDANPPIEDIFEDVKNKLNIK